MRWVQLLTKAEGLRDEQLPIAGTPERLQVQIDPFMGERGARLAPAGGRVFRLLMVKTDGTPVYLET